jgi:hypothetical protein
MIKYAKTQDALAKELGISRERLNKRYLSEEGNPGKTAKGFDVVKWKKFLSENRKRQLSGDGSLRDEKLLREIKKLDIDIEKMLGNLKPMEEWLDEVRLLVGIVQGGLDHFVQRVAAEKKDADVYTWAVGCRDDVLSKLSQKVEDARQAHS